MKLIRWVEVHIGRSKRKGKKDRVKDPTKDASDASSETPVSTTPTLVKHSDNQRISSDVDDKRSENNRSPPPWEDAKYIPSRAVWVSADEAVVDDEASVSAGDLHPDTPQRQNALLQNAGSRKVFHIRTSFLDPQALPEVNSPRQRSRIRTNPWLPSPRNSCRSSSGDSGWSGLRPSSTGSASSEAVDASSCTGSVFGDSQSSGSLRSSLGESQSTDGWTCTLGVSSSLHSSRELSNPALGSSLGNTNNHHTLLGHHHSRSSLQYSRKNHFPSLSNFHNERWISMETDRLSSDGEDGYHGFPFSRYEPKHGIWSYDLRDLPVTTELISRDSSDDEAYSEGGIPSEEQDEAESPVDPDSRHANKGNSATVTDTGSPLADSACGSDRDNSSCSTTPSSEIGPGSRNRSTVGAMEVHETLDDKVRRLRLERHLVEEKMREAREEELYRCEERLRFQQELVQYRRLLLLQTLQELRTRLEKQGKRLQRAYSATLEMQMNWSREPWEEGSVELP